MKIRTAILVEANGAIEFLLKLSPIYQEIAPGYPEIMARVNGGVVEVNDRGHITTRSTATYLVVVESVLAPGKATTVKLGP